MEYIALGKTDLKVSRICMGCMGFGDSSRGQHSWTLDEEHSREIIRNGLEQGINFFDTAIGYQNGTSKQYLGRALRDMTQRNNVVVATKFLPRTPEEIRKGVSGQQHIEHMIDASLRNLGMDYVDLYIYHMWDWNTPIYDILDGLGRVVKAGKARYIGISNCFAWQLAKANALAAQDAVIIDRVAELADKRGVTMTEVSLAWLLTKVTSPVVGATKLNHVDGAVKAVDLKLTEEETAYLEEPYVPHPLAGVMAQNKKKE